MRNIQFKAKICKYNNNGSKGITIPKDIAATLNIGDKYRFEINGKEETVTDKESPIPISPEGFVEENDNKNQMPKV